MLNLAGKDPKAATPRGRYSGKKPTIDALTCWPAAPSTRIRRTAGTINGGSHD
jgi:hypothetical protein